ncbi:hypothetical protein ACFVVX_10430 [Kitasatospora sp. NPDC058170]|uniref:hypothetical protein n=1 Tax=Kitasatospora sp. NPDC058170 TaxID=3346364 RepID=UPI0036D96309
MDSTVGHTPATHVTAHVAIYLRCYPFDVTAMDCHRRALEALAAELELPDPLLHLDNGLRKPDGLPALVGLLQGVAAGWITTVLIPGPFVFSMDGAEARAVVELLERHGCRVVELPPRGERARARTVRSLPPLRVAGSPEPVGAVAC